MLSSGMPNALPFGHVSNKIATHQGNIRGAMFSLDCRGSPCCVTLFFVQTATNQAGEPEAKGIQQPPIQEAPPPSLIHGLINFELSNAYITPRGLDVQNKGLVIQPLFLPFRSLLVEREFHQ